MAEAFSKAILNLVCLWVLKRFVEVACHMYYIGFAVYWDWSNLAEAHSKSVSIWWVLVCLFVGVEETICVLVI